MLNGVALAAAVQCEAGGSWLAGFGTFLVIVLHKPFDAMTISMLMGRSGWSPLWRHTINGLFSLAIPLGVLIFYFGLMPDQFSASAANQQWWIACALAFSAGTFLCISLSDLLPELQFHRHDRVKLSAALLLGLAVAHLAAQLEAAAHPSHTRPAPAVPVRPQLNSQEFGSACPRHALPVLPDRCDRRFHAVTRPSASKFMWDRHSRLSLEVTDVRGTLCRERTIALGSSIMSDKF
jgi:zinc and cadmium transporter